VRGWGGVSGVRKEGEWGKWGEKKETPCEMRRWGESVRGR